MSFPSPAEDYKQPRLALDDLIMHPEATYFVHNSGLSMEPIFHKGDVLIVDRAIVPLDGRAVVVIYREKFYVRRIITMDDQIILKADNPAFADIVALPDEIEVWGVVTYAIHKMR